MMSDDVVFCRMMSDDVAFCPMMSKNEDDVDLARACLNLHGDAQSCPGMKFWHARESSDMPPSKFVHTLACSGMSG